MAPTPHQATRRAPAALASVVVGLGLAAAACGADVGDSGYSEENREAFLTACTSSADDTRLIRDVCECTYDRIEDDLDFEEFANVEESLRLDALSSLPDSVTEFMADCFVEQVDL